MGTPTLDLHRYELLKSELANLLRAVPWRADQFERNRDLFTRLAEDRFNLAVVGRFSRGKSTLMNAMLGLDRLPTGIEPLTSVITSVTYGSHDKAVLYYENTTLFLDIRLDQLADYITERGNPGNRRRVREAEIQLPADLLRAGFRFIDTPGLGSPVAGNTTTTLGFLPEADAFLLVTGFDDPLNDEEIAVLRFAHSGARQVFVVINKLDTLEPGADVAILDELRTRLRRLGLPEQRLYPVSALDALGARLGHLPMQELQNSRLPSLEQDVLAFLTESKRQVFLRGLCTRLDAVLSGEAGLDAVRDRLTVLRREIEVALPPSSVAPQIGTPGAALPANLPGCLVCARGEKAVFDALASLQGRLRRDASARRYLAVSGGLCGIHARQLASHAAPREVCIGLAPSLDAQADRLLRLAERAEAGPLDAAAPDAGSSSCLLCEVADRTVEAVLDELVSALDAGGASAPTCPTLCVPHLARLLPRLHGHSVVPLLLRRQALILQRRADDMRRFALKQDASLRDQITAEENGAASHGVAALVGVPGLSAPLTKS